MSGVARVVGPYDEGQRPRRLGGAHTERSMKTRTKLKAGMESIIDILSQVRD